MFVDPPDRFLFINNFEEFYPLSQSIHYNQSVLLCQDFAFPVPQFHEASIDACKREHINIWHQSVGVHNSSPFHIKHHIRMALPHRIRRKNSSHETVFLSSQTIKTQSIPADSYRSLENLTQDSAAAKSDPHHRPRQIPDPAYLYR